MTPMLLAAVQACDCGLSSKPSNLSYGKPWRVDIRSALVEFVPSKDYSDISRDVLPKLLDLGIPLHS